MHWDQCECTLINRYRGNKVFRVHMHLFGVVEARTEPSLSTLLQGKQGVQGAYALVWGGLSTSNLLEPSRTTS